MSFLNNIIESAVIQQYVGLTKNQLDDEKQSAYKQFYNTETLLTKIHNESLWIFVNRVSVTKIHHYVVVNDIMVNLGNGDVTMLVLLDLSAAFDTIDHDILLQRLRNRYGLQGSALTWFKSYISNRSQSVVINDKTSDRIPLKFGVPQGSKLGPILFNSYIAPVSEVAQRNQICDQKYADDEQLILSFRPTFLGEQHAIGKMEKCISEIRDFLHENKLCNNGDKTELLLIGSSQQLKKLHVSSIKVENVEINAMDHVRNLGVIFDKGMTMEKQVNKMCQNAYFNMRNLSKLRRSLDRDTIKTAVNSLVTPHLDYGNGLLYGIKSSLLKKMQVAQNSAVRLIEKLKKHDSVNEFRKRLHWLPIPARIQFKLMTTTWKAMNDQAPKYIKQLLHKKPQQKYDLRSSSKKLLNEQLPRNKNKFEDRAFSFVAPKLWNKLPDSVRNAVTLESFKKNLKTHLFEKFHRS